MAERGEREQESWPPHGKRRTEGNGEMGVRRVKSGERREAREERRE